MARLGMDEFGDSVEADTNRQREIIPMNYLISLFDHVKGSA